MGGISKYLESDKGRIKQYLIDMMDISSDIMAQAGNYASALAYIFEVIASDSGQQITADIIGIFSEAFLGVHRLVSTIMRDVFKAITQPIIDTKETIKNSLQDLLNGLSEVTSAIKQIFADLIDLVMSLYNDTIAPIFQHLQERLAELLESHLSPFFSQLGETLGALGEALMLLWNNILQPLLQWIIDNIAPVITPIANGILDIVTDVINGILDLITGLLQVLEGLINFITGVFTGDWERAWNGIRDIFAGIINSISSMIETFVNGASSMINGLIGAFNKITGIVGIPSIPDIPKLKIPKLATGAVIPPNAPFMAMLGDQRHGTNIEAPLDTIKQAVREVIGSGNSGGMYQFVAQIDGRTIFESVISEAQLRQSSTGQNKLVTL
jgi:phage-related protein